MKFKINADAKWDNRLALPWPEFQKVRDAIANNVTAELLDNHAETLETTYEKYRKGGTGDLAMRVRWDAFWAARKHLESSLPDFTDKQMDSVLRRIVTEI